MRSHRNILLAALTIGTVVIALILDAVPLYFGTPISIGAPYVVLAIGGLATLLISLWSRERQRFSAEIAKQTAQKQQFVDRLHHQIKNPLQVIKLAISNLQYSIPDEADTLTRLQNQTERLSELINGLHQLYELDAQSLEFELVNIDKLLQLEVETLKEQTGREINFRILERPWEISPIRGDPELLQIAVNNVLQNALKYSPRQIDVSAVDNRNQIQIEITDYGIGIPTNDLPYITEELFRGENTTDIPGSGLGLPLVRRIVELHDGILDINSRADQGTVVTLRLPTMKL